MLHESSRRQGKVTADRLNVRNRPDLKGTKIGLGGYVVGRSAEKIVPAFAKKRSETEAKG